MIKVVWAGLSGTQYEFEVYVIGQEFYPVSGVYILCKAIGLVGYEGLYVGETESFEDRLNTGPVNHDGYERALRAGATHVAVMRTHDKANRLRIETDLRHGLDPVCNRQGVGLGQFLKGGLGGL